MRRFTLFALLLAVPFVFAGCGCERVDQGYRGAKIDLYGDEKGAMQEVGKGMHFYNPITHTMIQLPIHVQRYAYVKNPNEETPTDQSIKATSADNLEFTVGVALQYYVNPKSGCVSEIYQTYKTNNFRTLSRGPIRDLIREEIHSVFSQYEAGEIYGSHRPEIMNRVTDSVKAEFRRVAHVQEDGENVGCFVVSNIGLAELQAPRSVINAVEKKMKAQQRAQQARAELKEQKIQSRSDSVEAAQDAENNRIIARSVTPELIKYKKLTLLEKKWNGELPKVVSGENGLMLNMSNVEQ